jgi:hypothetical protein
MHLAALGLKALAHLLERRRLELAHPLLGQAKSSPRLSSVRGSSRSLRSRTMNRSRSLRPLSAITSQPRSCRCRGVLDPLGRLRRVVLQRVDPLAPLVIDDCVALSEKSDPDRRPSIISTSCSGTPTSVAIICRSWWLSRCSPRRASRSSRACTRRMLKNSDFCDEVEPGAHHRPVAHHVILDRRLDPPDGIGREAHAAVGVELVGRLHQPKPASWIRSFIGAP